MASNKDTLSDADRERIGPAIGKIPSGFFILTAAHEDRRTGMLCSWVQQVCFEPAMVSVAVAKGRPIMPLISESRKFALCQLRDDDRTVLRKFAAGHDVNDDPFLGIDLVENKLHVPVIRNTLGYVVCELSCHMDVEGDHDLFVGTVKDGGFHGGEPRVHVRSNGFSY